MNMISTIKNGLKTLLIDCGIGPEHIAFLAKEEAGLHQKNIYPIALIITAEGSYKDGPSQEIDYIRILPFEIRIYDTSEERSLELTEMILEKLPGTWQYEGQEGEIEPVHEKHSDHETNMNAYYSSAIGLKFSMYIKKEHTRD